MSHDLFTRATNAQDALDAIHESKNPTDFARRLKGFSDENIADALDLDPGVLSTKKDPAKFAAKLSKNVLPHLITRQAGAKWVDDLLDVDKREFARSAALEACSAEKLIQVVKAEGISLPIHATLHLAVGEGRIRLEDLADFVVDGVPGFQTMVRMMQEDMKLDLMCLTEYQDRLVKVARGSECYITQHHAADPRVVKAFPLLPTNSVWQLADQMLVSDQVPVQLAEEFMARALESPPQLRTTRTVSHNERHVLSPGKEDLAFAAVRAGASGLLHDTSAAIIRSGTAPSDVMEKVLDNWMLMAPTANPHRGPRVTARTWREIIARFKESSYMVASYRLDDAELPLMDDFLVHLWPSGILSQVVDYKIRTNPDEAMALLRKREQGYDGWRSTRQFGIDLKGYSYTEEHLPILAELCWNFEVSLTPQTLQEVLCYTFGGADRDTVRVVCDMATEQDLSLEEAQVLARSLS